MVYSELEQMIFHRYGQRDNSRGRLKMRDWNVINMVLRLY